jgi:hypothetical protein
MRDNKDIKSISEAYVSMLTEAKGNYYEVGGDPYDGGVVLNVYVNGKKVFDTIRDGDQDFKYKNKKYSNITKLLDAIAKDNSGVSSAKDFERKEMK